MALNLSNPKIDGLKCDKLNMGKKFPKLESAFIIQYKFQLILVSVKNLLVK